MPERVLLPGRLYIVPTPIGNLEDITVRAARILGCVHKILAEDTRRTGILCQHLKIGTPVIHVDDHNIHRLLPGILEELRGGAHLALVSDAGTPGISDPGVALVRAAAGLGVVEALPGASAVTTALSGSGFSGDRFVFEGFLPRKGRERQIRLEAVAQEERSVVFFESPQRLAATLADLVAIGAGARLGMVARELTKLHESCYWGTLTELAARFAQANVRGEIVVVLEGATVAPPSDEQVFRLMDAALADGLGVRDASRRVAEQSGRPVSWLYALALRRRCADHPGEEIKDSDV
ncbi:MAG: 16S rRNA (cytidine(1402)-2'-O)-methyltransferase [Magnetococcales bacterium]|nr:16S rRNA (cytidine(1402)-2'-O)-methyltransferase [Magnetococcales bacterium]